MGDVCWGEPVGQFVKLIVHSGVFRAAAEPVKRMRAGVGWGGPPYKKSPCLGTQQVAAVAALRRRGGMSAAKDL
ncbi:MAG: hypothetical protein ACLR23_11825 [Clostridia bacterium]